jgi:hypothetical protein
VIGYPISDGAAPRPRPEAEILRRNEAMPKGNLRKSKAKQ